MSRKEKYEKEIVEVIKKNNLFVIQDIFAFYTGIKSSQFYNLELEKSECIIKAILDNKSMTCQSLKNKWYRSENATLQIALFKTICSDEEAHRLNGTRIETENTHKGGINVDINVQRRKD
jgi:hypothetical protein